MNPYKVVQDFEKAICDYTGAPCCTVTTSCTMALLLACAFCKQILEFKGTVTIPKHTYIGVPQSIIHAGFDVQFKNEDWTGSYQLDPLPVWDYARRFTSDMYVPGQMQCVSFHWTKILGIGQGGAILHCSPEADQWLKRARFDGRTEGVPVDQDHLTHLGYHAYMSPRDAAEGLSRLAVLPKHNKDLPWDNYPDLSQFEVFRAAS